MAFREVRVFEVREVLRLWLGDQGSGASSGWSGVDRKTVRRYVEAAVEAGLDRGRWRGAAHRRVPGAGGGDGSGRTASMVMARRGGCSRRIGIRSGSWLENDDLTVAKVGMLLARQGVVVPGRTLRPVRRRVVRSSPGPGHHGPGGRRRAGRSSFRSTSAGWVSSSTPRPAGGGCATP